MCDEKRFTILAVLTSDPKEGSGKATLLYKFFREAYTDGEEDSSNPDGQGKKKVKSIWKGLYMYSDSKKLLSDLDEYIDDYKIDPNKILVILGWPDDFKFVEDATDFSFLLEKYIKRGLNVVVATDAQGYERLAFKLDGVKIHLLDLENPDIFRKSEWLNSAISFKNFINAAF